MSEQEAWKDSKTFIQPTLCDSIYPVPLPKTQKLVPRGEPRVCVRKFIVTAHPVHLKGQLHPNQNGLQQEALIKARLWEGQGESGCEPILLHSFP